MSTLIVVLTFLAQTQPAPTPAAPPKPPLIFERIAAGDLDGDGRDEVVRWISDSKEVSVWSYSGAAPRKLSSTVLERFPTLLKVDDLDGDGKAELLIGEGLRGYNPKTGPQTDAHLVLYRPLSASAWKGAEIFRMETERPQFTSIEIQDTDGDGKREILFALFASKYMCAVGIARPAGGSWKVEQLPQIRMGTSVVAADFEGRGKPVFAVGRPYGDDLGILGDAFLLRDENRVPLPVHRGVSGLAVGSLKNGEPPILVAGDGWHQDYGKIARGRIAVLRLEGGKWTYSLIEDVPEQMRFVEIELRDLDGDGTREIAGRAERRNSLGGDLRIYQRTSAGWRGMTAARDVQGYALGRFRGEGIELALTGTTELRRLDLARETWDSKLAPEVETFEVDPKSLVGKPAPRISAETWIGSEPLTLDSLKGKVVLLDFWATWCKPCIAQFPKMREWAESFKNQGFTILGITDLNNQTRADIDAFLEKHKLPWPVAIDPSKRTAMYFGVGPIPHSVLIGRDGAIRLAHVGAAKMDDLEREIQKLLAEPR